MALRVEIEPAGFAPESVQRLTGQVQDHPALRRALEGSEYRLLDVRPLEADGSRKPSADVAEKRFRATVYDYTRERAVEVSGSLSSTARAGRALRVTELDHQPLPSTEEFDLAVQWLAKDPRWGRLLVDEGYTAMPHVPPVLPVDGRTKRGIGVQLVPSDPAKEFRTAAVDLLRGEVHEAEVTGLARASCAGPSAGQNVVTNRPGKAWITIWQGQTRLWRFLARRPAGSSGTNGSGIDLRHVEYRGKRVLGQAHVPILNVKYERDRCGPFLDWQNWESPFQAHGTTPVPGFRLCDQPPQTIIESESDHGNFAGVAVHVDGNEVRLVSEMEAGWYRYISEWRFHANGTIKPRFGFAGVRSSCVCNKHFHHCYWRLDFDIRTAGKNIVREYNDPPLEGQSSHWHVLAKETGRNRNYARDRKWRVAHTPTRSAYEIRPGDHDGVAKKNPDYPFGQGDLWVVRRRPGEIDHGVVATGPPYRANIDGFVTGETVRNRDLVVWYAAHYTHDATSRHGDGELLGPDLVPINW